MTENPNQSFLQRCTAAITEAANVVGEQREALRSQLLSVGALDTLDEMRAAAAIPAALRQGNRIDDAVSVEYVSALDDIATTDADLLTRFGETTPLVKSSPERGVREIINEAIRMASLYETRYPVQAVLPIERGGLGR